MSSSFVNSVWQAYVDDDMMVITEPSKRGRKPKAIYQGKELQSDHVALLENWVMQMNAEQGGVTAKKLQAKFRADLDLHIERPLIRYVLHRLGYEWGSAKKVSRKVLKSKKRSKQVHDYLVRYADALRRQREGKAVVVYMDETYAHQNHSANNTWFKSKSIFSRIMRVGSGKGVRYIIVNAMSEDGLLYVIGEERQEDTEDLDEVDRAETAEWVFEGPTRKGDYHKNMNGDNFMKWVKYRLLPAFEAKFDKKQLILVLDNAPYHHAHDESFIDVASMNREEVINFLITKANKSQIVFTRDGEDISADLFVLAGRKRATGGDPKVFELKEVAKAIIQGKPEWRSSRIQKLFSEKGYELIFTPPYTPSLQPIELTWSNVKRYVAEEFFPGRTSAETRVHILEGFFGRVGDPERNGYTKQTARNHIAHCHKACNYFINEDPLLSGTIDNLKILDRSDIEEVEEESEGEMFTDNDTYFNGHEESDDEGSDVDL